MSVGEHWQAELLPVFRDEAAQRLDEIVGCLLDLEAGRAADDVTDELFRHAHSLKGSAGMVGLVEARDVAAELENILERARGEGPPAAAQVEALLRLTDDLRRAIEIEPAEGGAPALTPAASDEPVRASPSFKIPAEKIDRMLNAVGETVLHHRRLEHMMGRSAPGAEDELEREVDLGERLLSELQDAVLGMRSLPLRSITAPYPRAVRDAAKAHGVEADLVITGGDTQLDRAVLEGLSDAIGHLLRNAVAHGIETPEERERAGKPRRGRIELSAVQRGGVVAIDVRDDGRGVARAALAEVPAEGSLVELLATPGYSTAGHVCGLAGRGVGLDAVKRHAEGIGGCLEISTEPGRGTRVTLLLPVTLALMRVLVVERAGRRFGLPLASVAEVLELGKPMTLAGRPAIELRGERLWLADLIRVLGGHPSDATLSRQALVIRWASNQMAFACDVILGEQEVVVKPLGFGFEATPGYLGAAVLGDGGIALILDSAFLVRGAVTTTPAPAHRPPVERAPTSPRILVVDDQRTARELQRKILTAAGYRVETARDGRDALEVLARRGPFDLVVTDLQMPAMTGGDLLRTIRGDAERAAMPVIVITSNSEPETDDGEAGSGADAFIPKQEFDERALLATITDLIGAS